MKSSLPNRFLTIVVLVSLMKQQSEFVDSCSLLKT